MHSHVNAATADVPIVLGHRIVIYGATGSGKTTLARRLGEILGLGVIELDAIRHDGAFDATPWDEMRQRIEAAIETYPVGWVCEGNYNRVRNVSLSRADTLISLDLPWRTSFWRLLKRTVHRVRTREPLFAPNGPRETWRGTFLSRQSILLWSITDHQRRKRTTAQAIADAPVRARVYRLRTPRDVAALLRAAERQTELSQSEAGDSWPIGSVTRSVE
jgi:adenylate kinase family enzyme